MYFFEAIFFIKMHKKRVWHPGQQGELTALPRAHTPSWVWDRFAAGKDREWMAKMGQGGRERADDSPLPSLSPLPTVPEPATDDATFNRQMTSY